MNKVLHIILLFTAISLGCIACTNEDSPQPTLATGEGQLRILYKLAGSPQTRASFGEEAGWKAWNENKIVRLDLFVFDDGGTCVEHIESAGTEENPLVNREDGDKEYTPLVTDKLTYEDVKEGNYTYYMVANCQQLAGIDKDDITLEQLKAEMIDNAITWNQQQAFFVMDDTATPQIAGEQITLSFDLERAAAKVRLTVKDESGTNLTNQCEFRFHNYVQTGTSVLAGMEKYGKGTGQQRESMSAMNSVANQLMYGENNSKQAVFYTYPNSWMDESKIDSTGSGNNKRYTIADYASQDPIVREEQTYILLKAPYEGVDYYYEIPVNLSTYKDHDKLNFTKDELEKIRDLYRMNRNHIYDITATIDRRGGGLDLQYEVLDWDDGGSIDISYGDEFSGTLTTTTATRITEDGEAYAIVYGDDTKWVTFTFRMTTPIAATWTANLTNGSQFELVSDNGLASGIGVGDSEDSNEGLVTFTVRPTQEFDVDQIHETELYISVLSVNGEHLGEQLINPESRYPGNTMRIKIRQVSLDQWNDLQQP